MVDHRSGSATGGLASSDRHFRLLTTSKAVVLSLRNWLKLRETRFVRGQGRVSPSSAPRNCFRGLPAEQVRSRTPERVAVSCPAPRLRCRARLHPWVCRPGAAMSTPKWNVHPPAAMRGSPKKPRTGCWWLTVCSGHGDGPVARCSVRVVAIDPIGLTGSGSGRRGRRAGRTGR